ncbi:hypothetical protein DICPUDRAFT_96383 [Dictyostelium purpureum]|uniref:Uncharacterized protein n=1 Tax=Dictyostelium purpureum TaxID=5786 RepID=F0Z7R9_DICPU|nr:uncharacterized protein DICPUDRAFT_96383 [Dictyostelium purpureum]EGC39992.1 hypothetical protein DICPUDRAFT_96383 [Dictyostelium purpureum]|eukprot:XP_003283495.1 hypothetical protein DICPUDRAFT_96383 [Dictyostelium purpureum]
MISINKLLLNPIHKNNNIYKTLSKTLLFNNTNALSPITTNNDKYYLNKSNFASKNYKTYKNFKDQRKFYEEEYKKQKQQEKYYREAHEQQQKHYKESHEQQQQQQQYQQEKPNPIMIPIFKILFKLLGTILFGWLRKKFSPTEYKELFNFTTETLRKQKILIQDAIGGNQPLVLSKEPKLISTSFIPRHSQFMNQEDQVMMVCEIPLLKSHNDIQSLHTVTLAESLPDVVVEESFPWNLFTPTKTIKSARPIRVTLLIENYIDNPYLFVFSQKRELILYESAEHSTNKSSYDEYDVFEGNTTQNNMYQEEEEEDENGQHYQEKHQNRNYQNNSRYNNHNNRKQNEGDTIVLDPKDFREVTNKKK